MSLPLPSLRTAFCLLACSPLLLAAPPVKKQGFDAYSLVQTRNIFDPERQPGVTATAAASPTPASGPVTNADYAALTGTMITADKMLAFFSGTRPEYNAVLGLRGVIAGAVITRITPAFVEVKRNGKPVVVVVGQTVPLDDASVPTAAPIATAPILTSSTSSTPTSATPTAIPTTPGATPSSAEKWNNLVRMFPAIPTTPGATPSSAPVTTDRDALIRRMMEKRQQELQ